MEDTQPVVEEDINEEVYTEESVLREQLPPLFLCPLSEGSGRVLRYRSGLSLRSPLSQPLIRQSNNCGISVNDGVFSTTESRTPEQSSYGTVLASSVASASTQSPQGGIGELGLPLNITSGLGEDNIASVDREAIPSTTPSNGISSESSSGGQEQRHSSIHSAYFTIGDQDDSQSQMNVPNDNDVSLPIDPVSPPSYETVCQKKGSREPNGSSRNTMDSLQLPTYRDAIGRGRYLEGKLILLSLMHDCFVYSF